MRQLFITFILLFSLPLLAKTQISAILSLQKGALLSEKDTVKVLRHPSVVANRDLFTEEEKKALQQLHMTGISKAWVLTLKSPASFDTLERQIRRWGLPLNLDWNEVDLKTQSFESLQWALNNTGLPQMIDLDSMQNYRVQARAGEDVNLATPSPLLKKKILVAVLDTGIDHQHPNLTKVLHRNEPECKALEKFKSCLENSDRKSCEAKWFDVNNPEVDQDKNGYPLDCSGWSTLGGVNAANIMGRPDFEDDQGHGTHVAGIIAASANSEGIRGISQNVEILPVQVLGLQPSEPVKPLSVDSSVDLSPTETGKEAYTRSLGDLVARGVIYAVRSGAKVINFSMGWPQNRDSEFLRMVIAEAQARGVVVVAAAGNDSTRALLRPCAYPGVICVGAHGPDGALAHFSNFSSGVDIAAPGINILSTYPLAKRPVRFRSTLGYEYLSGTSQATPYVAGAVAEMLARSVPVSEIKSRLILGSRKIQAPLNLLAGTDRTGYSNLNGDTQAYDKYLVGGNLSVTGALAVMPQPLIVPASKERSLIKWDGQSSELKWNFKLKNEWLSVPASLVQLRAQLYTKSKASVAPQVTALDCAKGKVESSPAISAQDLWATGEERECSLKLFVSEAVMDRFASELDLVLGIQIGKEAPRKFILEADVISLVSSDMVRKDAQALKLPSLPVGQLTWLPIDENFDTQYARDYFVISQQGNQWKVSLLAQPELNSDYQLKGTAKIKIEGNVDNTRTQISARIDVNGDGVSDYVLGLIETFEDGETLPVLSLYYFDSQMRLIDSFKYDSKLATFPFSNYWIRVKGQMRPAWVGFGKDPNKKKSVRDLWENPRQVEKNQLRFYYFDENKKLQAFQSSGDYKVIDVIDPTEQQKQAGVVPLILAKNLGTEARPSYLYDFGVAEATDQGISSVRSLGIQKQADSYRNLLDTRVDKVQSLDGQREIDGTFWFSEGVPRTQRLSWLRYPQAQFLNRDLTAIRSQFDSALWVRAVFAGASKAGAFVLTNSEIQYHDLKSSAVVSRSLERYTFYPDMLFTNLFFPLIVKDATQNSLSPALFTTESSGISRGVKMLVPIFAKNANQADELVDLVSPARLRLATEKGCRPLNTPVFTGAEGHAFDYFCGDKILRFKLKF